MADFDSQFSHWSHCGEPHNDSNAWIGSQNLSALMFTIVNTAYSLHFMWIVFRNMTKCWSWWISCWPKCCPNLLLPSPTKTESLDLPQTLLKGKVLSKQVDIVNNRPTCVDASPQPENSALLHLIKTRFDLVKARYLGESCWSLLN